MQRLHWKTDQYSENLDPEGTKSDADLNDVLCIVHMNSRASSSLCDKFKLDMQVSAEGSNFSAGEKQLCRSCWLYLLLMSVALMRALVSNCKILLLDEATSSVDLETDTLIQRIIQTQFAEVTVGTGWILHLPATTYFS